MYHHFYHLKHDPFADTPDPEFLFLSPSHKIALQTILEGIAKRRGVITVCGAAGLGKTILLHAFLEGIHEQQHLKTVQIFYPRISRQEMGEILCRGLGLPHAADDFTALLPQFQQALLMEYQQGWNVTVVVDDVQDMAAETLGSLLQLATLQTAAGVHLVQIVLVGLPTVWQRLKALPPRTLRRQSVKRATLVPLTAKESLAYLRHRLAKLLVPEEALFVPGALTPLIRAAHGNPRVLNTLCANVLITGVVREQKPIPVTLVQEVLAESGEQRSRPYRAWSGMVLAGVCLGVGLWVWWPSSRPGNARPDVSSAAMHLRPHEVIRLPLRPETPGTIPDSVGSETPSVHERPHLPLQKEKTKRALIPRERLPRQPLPAAKDTAEQARQEKTSVRLPMADKTAPVSGTLRGADQRKSAPSPQRTIRIYSQPRGARVTIDRKAIGHTPLTVRLIMGVHTITLDKPGYTRISYDINLHNHTSKDLYYDLQVEKRSQ
jgi:general secretion pathway protein A